MSYQFTAGRFKGWASDNTPLAGGRLYTYASGTTTQKNVYTDATLGAACTYVSDGVGGLYIALDSKGEAQLWLGSGAYTFKLTDSLGATVWTVDGVRDQSDAALAQLSESSGSSLVGFIQSGAGAVAGTVELELRRDVWAGQYSTVDQAIAQSPLSVTHLGAGTTTTTAAQLSGTSVAGIGPGATLKAGGTSTVLNLGYVNSPSQWTSKCLSMLTVDGNAKASDGVTFADSASTQVSGRWVIEKSTFLDCKKAIHKPTGNIGNTLRDVSIKDCDYGYYAVASASPLMHAGCDTLDRVHIAATALAAVYIDSSVSGTGGTKLVDTIIEANPGFGVFVKNWATGYTPLTLDNVWFESNATSGTVTINGTPYTPVDLYLENASHVVLVNGIVPKQNLSIHTWLCQTASCRATWRHGALTVNQPFLLIACELMVGCIL